VRRRHQRRPRSPGTDVGGRHEYGTVLPARTAKLVDSRLQPDQVIGAWLDDRQAAAETRGARSPHSHDANDVAKYCRHHPGDVRCLLPHSCRRST